MSGTITAALILTEQPERTAAREAGGRPTTPFKQEPKKGITDPFKPRSLIPDSNMRIPGEPGPIKVRMFDIQDLPADALEPANKVTNKLGGTGEVPPPGDEDMPLLDPREIPANADEPENVTRDDGKTVIQ